jgi:cytochrome c553
VFIAQQCAEGAAAWQAKQLLEINGTFFMQILLGKAVLLLLAMSVAPWAAAQDVKGNPAAAKRELCIGCHGIPGYRWAFPEVYHVPKIHGQSERYIVNALQAYKKGDRKHASMRAVAAQLTDQEIADLAAYYAGQKQ